MRRLAAICFIMTLCSSTLAVAQVADGDYDVVREAQQLGFVNTGDHRERAVGRGDTIVDVPLVWERAARLSKPVTLTADAENISLPAGAILPITILGKKGSNAKITAYCTPRVAAERKAETGVLGFLMGGGSAWRKILRNATDKQFCLLDANDDGIADQSVMIHAGTPLARMPVAIAPVALKRVQDVPISPSDDRFVVVVTDVSGKGKDVTVRLKIIQQGKPREFDTFGDTSRITTLSAKNGLPIEADIARARFDVVAIDGPARRATVQWPGNLNEKAFVIIPDGLAVGIRYF